MPKPFLTDKHKAFIKANRLKMSGTKMAEKFGCGKSVVNKYMRDNGLQVPKSVSLKFRADALRGRTNMTAQQDAFIQENYLKIPVKRLAKIIGKSGTGVNVRLKQLGLKIPKELAEERRVKGLYKPGHKSFNKGKKQTEYMSAKAIEKTKATRFKKGNLPHNTKFDGAERTTKDGYIEVRVRLGKYRLKHLHNWELINGPLPEGHCLRCVSDDITNCEPSNWKLIARAENMELNRIHHYPEDLKQSIKLLNKINKSLNQLTEMI